MSGLISRAYVISCDQQEVPASATLSREEYRKERDEDDPRGTFRYIYMCVDARW